MSEVVEVECESCGAVTSVEVTLAGELGTQIKFCPVCGEEIDDDHDDFDDEDDFWGMDDEDDDD